MKRESVLLSETKSQRPGWPELLRVTNNKAAFLSAYNKIKSLLFTVRIQVNNFLLSLSAQDADLLLSRYKSCKKRQL